MYHILTLKFISLRFKLSPIIHCMKWFIVLEFVKEIFCDLEISRISPETMPLQNWIILPCVTWIKVDWWKDRHCIGKCMTAPSKLKISRKEDTFTSYTCHECCVSENSASTLRRLKACLQTTMSHAGKIESLHDSPRWQGNDWKIEHVGHWKSVCLISNERQNRFGKFDVNWNFLKSSIER